MILPLVFGIVGTAILVSLGVWQLQRLTWKQGVLADIDARMTTLLPALPETPDPDFHKYALVSASGVITGDEIHVLVSKKGTGAGYRIISRFETGGRAILVDRGFIPAAFKDSERLPLNETITGNLHWPDEIDSFTPDADIEGNIWFARDVPAMAETLGTEPLMIIASKTSRSYNDVTPMPIETADIPNNHLEYVITWFSLAAIWVGMTAFLLRRISQKKI
jgi:surfeit locus 1 family protein